MPQYIDPVCNRPALGHKITIPFTTYNIDTEDFNYVLGHKDYSISSSGGNISVSVKTGRFVKNISAVNKVFAVKLFNIEASTLLKIRRFSKADFLNLLETGEGVVSVDLDGEVYTGCYIDSPIESSESIFDTSSGIEFFDEVNLSIVRPAYTWY
jgi:hypothetical protein